jgi:hypothetical protein
MYESELDFDTGVSFMPALLASVSLCNSTESPVASCPKGLGYPKARLIFGVQSVEALTTNLYVHSSIPEGQPSWLPDPCTAGNNSLEEVLANLKYVSNFAQTNLTPQQTSQILWAGYGCTPHTPTGKVGLTVPSAWANYYLTRSIYLMNENGTFRYNNRNPATNLSTRDHRLEDLSSTGGRGREQSGAEDDQQPVDIRQSLRSAITGLPQAPAYVILCLDSSYVGQEYPALEVGFVAGNMLIQASAIDLGCHFKSNLTSDEKSVIQNLTRIPSSHVPQAIVSIGSVEATVSISVVFQSDVRTDTFGMLPLTIAFFTSGADALNDTPVYELNLATAKSVVDNVAVYEATGIAPGTYDITVIGSSTLMNLKRNIDVASPTTSVNMGSLLAGNANRDSIINLDDYVVLSSSWMSSAGRPEYDSRADFDRNGIINITDLSLMSANWLKTSPIEISP